MAYSLKGTFISQQKYIRDLLKDSRRLTCKQVSTLIDLNKKLGKCEEGNPVIKEKYQCLIGRLVYWNHSWPDITFAGNVLSLFIPNPKEDHLRAA